MEPIQSHGAVSEKALSLVTASLVSASDGTWRGLSLD